MAEKTFYKIAKDHQLLVVIILFLTLIVMIIALFINQTANAPKFAIISKDGKILYESNFNQYRLFVKKEKLKKEIENGSIEELNAYILRFNKPPDYWEISSSSAVVREITKINEKEYSVIFFTPWGWFGGKSVECNFKIQAF